jgi:predicted ATP-dependent serine protease
MPERQAFLANTREFERVSRVIDEKRPEFLVIDSLQLLLEDRSMWKASIERNMKSALARCRNPKLSIPGKEC